MSKNVRRVFDREFKVLAVRRMLAGDSPMALARELGVLRKDLYLWRDAYQRGGAEGLVGRGRPRKAPPLKSPPPPEAAGAGKPAAPPGPARQRKPKPGPVAPAHAQALARIAELERKIGQQQLELDFFQRALRQVEVERAKRGLPAATGSTRSSKP
jgi:transposase